MNILKELIFELYDISNISNRPSKVFWAYSKLHRYSEGTMKFIPKINKKTVEKKNTNLNQYE